MKHIHLHNIEFFKEHKGFEKRCKDEGRSTEGIKHLVRHSKEFLHWLEETGIDNLESINQQIIDDFCKHLMRRPNMRKEGGIKGTYFNKYREGVLRFLEYYFGYMLGQSPFEIPTMETDPPEKDVLTEEEVIQIYNSCDNTFKGITDRAMIALLYGAGLRRQELCTLELSDLDLKDGFINLDKTKTKHERSVPMFPLVQRALEEYLYNAREMMLPENNDVTEVMVTEVGDKMSYSSYAWRVNKMAMHAGITKKVSPHLFRHSIATHLLEHMSLEEIGDFLGHQCLDSTQIYTRIKNGLV